MKALSLWQPWATAIACGAKKIETRSWSTNYRGPIAIHAAKTWNDQCALAYGTLVDREDFYQLLPKDDDGRLHELPLGAIVAYAELVDVTGVINLIGKLTPLEQSLGNYSEGRYGWILEDVKLIVPVPAKGRQGLWNCEE
jgi:hypothetical protein